jgi:2-polyprenyl-3-methyl-5-hydroxy-6-metoxy-1,4-benzoquinol methylase
LSLTSIRDPAVLGAMLPDGCTVCGGREFAYGDVLWQGLIDKWQLNPDEAHYVNVQQGLACRACGANLRSIVLAGAICDAMNHQGTLSGWIASAARQRTALLEINEAGGLTPCLRKAPGHLLVNYPDTDMHAMPFDANSFDLVLHSDTLEHVENPVHALAECRRVLRPGGILALTVPTIVGWRFEDVWLDK